jgi:hypothetical protein
VLCSHIAPETTLTSARQKNQDEVAQRKIAADRAKMRKMSAIISGLEIDDTVVYEG